MWEWIIREMDWGTDDRPVSCGTGVAMRMIEWCVDGDEAVLFATDDSRCSCELECARVGVGEAGLGNKARLVYIVGGHYSNRGVEEGYCVLDGLFFVVSSRRP
jgi:hypothetical protein